MEAFMLKDEAVLLTAATLLARTLANSGREEATDKEVEDAVTLALRNGEKLLKELDKQRGGQDRKALEQGWLEEGSKQHAEQTKRS
jgi:hypothetical protein